MQKLIVVPARGGSKGIPGKNIYPLRGKPLLSYTLELIRDAELTDTDVAVSTDSKDIMNVAEDYSWVYIIERPKDISGDMARTEDALIHSLDYLENKLGKAYEAVITMQVTSPLRRPETLQQFIKNFEENYPDYDSQISLNEDRTDFWVKHEDGSFARLYPDAPRRRQDRKPLYVENSAYYMTGAASLRATGSVLGKKVNGFVISGDEAIDINEPVDLLVAEAALNMREMK